MLKRFEVQGFKNFKDKVILDFSDSSEYKFNTQCISNKLIREMIIYGKNGVGKTNFGLALFDIVGTLTDKNVGDDLYSRYLNADSLDRYASFKYVFEFDKNIIEYFYVKSSKDEFIEETLTLNYKILINRNINLTKPDLTGISEITPTLNWKYKDERSLVAYAIHNSSLEPDHPLYKLMDYVSHMLWVRNLNYNRYVGYKTNTLDYYSFIFEKKYLKEFENFLNENDIDEHLVARENEEGKKELCFDKTVPLNFFKTASSGTISLYTSFYWMKTCPDISLFFLDEFDSFYHFELSEAIVKLLGKMTKTQVIFTSHNTNLLSNSIMRPDCFFILTKGGLKSFANSTKRELREGHNLEKLYQSGEFNE
ncbi:MAG: AAA family ATPase [Sphaerochaetaceae bacterium]